MNMSMGAMGHLSKMNKTYQRIVGDILHYNKVKQNASTLEIHGVTTAF